MTVAGTLRARRDRRDRREAVDTRRTLLAAAQPLRAAAQRQVNAGHPELAAPYLDEAEMFESAARRVVGL